ncbi:unnamed protein product, partial [Nesidiocoris tenuis]
MHHKAELCRMWNASPSCDEEEEWRLRRSCSFLRAESRRTFLPNFLNLFNNCRCRKTASESERRFYPEKRELLANLELQRPFWHLQVRSDDHRVRQGSDNRGIERLAPKAIADQADVAWQMGQHGRRRLIGWIRSAGNCPQGSRRRSFHTASPFEKCRVWRMRI